MTTPDRRYADLLGPDSAPERAQLVRALEQAFTASPPSRLANAMDRTIEERLDALSITPPTQTADGAPEGRPRARVRLDAHRAARRSWLSRLPSLVLALLALAS